MITTIKFVNISITPHSYLSFLVVRTLKILPSSPIASIQYRIVSSRRLKCFMMTKTQDVSNTSEQLLLVPSWDSGCSPGGQPPRHLSLHFSA